MTPRKRAAPRKPTRPVSAPPVVRPEPYAPGDLPIFRQLVEERGGFPGVTLRGGEGGN